MAQRIEGDLVARQHRVAIVVSRFNDFITQRLLEAAIDAYVRHGGDADRVDTILVPGSYELPLAALKLAQRGRHDAIVCLGCVIRGETGHYDAVANEATKGIAQVSLDTGLPVAFGVVMADHLEQAIDRAGAKQGNAGAKAMLTALEMANLIHQLDALD